MDVLCYTYDADHHCVECTKKYIHEWFCPDSAKMFYNGDTQLEDGEGNPIRAMLDNEEWYANDIYDGNTKATLTCGTCGELIEEVDLS